MSGILKISEAASLALHSMYLLSMNAGSSFTTKELASALDVSENHLSKILQRLAKEGFIKSIRGPRGGFMLNKSSKDITLLEIYEAINGSLDLSDCLMKKPVCNNGICMLGTLLKTVNAQIKEHLSTKRLSDYTTHNS